MQTHFAREYDFAPATFRLPKQHRALVEFCQSNPHKNVFICKPFASCQGRGIHLVTDAQRLPPPTESVIVQEYIQRPYLIDGLKFDFRVYVLVRNFVNLKAYMYGEGLARFATIKYEPLSELNQADLKRHLTNYSINKKSPEFVFNDSECNDGIGHKRSLSSVMKV